MKKTLLTFLTLLLLFPFASLTHAQGKTSSSETKNPHPVSVKVSPILQAVKGLLPISHNIIGVEVFLNPGLSLDQEVSPIFSRTDPEKINGSNSVVARRGIYTQSRVRFYDRKKAAGNSFFFSPGINFRYMDTDVREYLRTAGGRTYDLNWYTVARREWQAELAFGIRHTFSRVYFEGSFGPNFRFVDSNHDETRLNDIPYPRESNGYRRKPHPEGSIFAPALKGNLRIGVIFGKLPGETVRLENKGHFRRGVVKFYPLPAFFNDYRMGYEIPLGQKVSLGLQGGYHKSRYVRYHEDNSTLLGHECTQFFPVSGFNVKVGPRLYLKPPGSMNRWYLENWTGLTYTEYPTYQHYLRGDCRDDYFQIPSKTITPVRRTWSNQFNFGVQVVAGQRMVFDIYAGPGFEVRHVTENQDREITPQPGATQEVIDFYAQREFYRKVLPMVFGGVAIGWGL